MGATAIIELACERDEDCGFVGAVEAYVFNQSDEDHGQVSWTCPCCRREQVDEL